MNLDQEICSTVAETKGSRCLSCGGTIVHEAQCEGSTNEEVF